MDQKLVKTILVLIVIAVIGFAGYKALNVPEQRTMGETMGDAVNALGEGVDKAAKELESRTPAEKLGDAVDDAAKDIKESVQP